MIDRDLATLLLVPAFIVVLIVGELVAMRIEKWRRER